MILYPLLSVYPQELIFRTFFFHRYRQIFRQSWVLILASGLSFGLAHLFFANWIAPTLTLLGGLQFARTYDRTNSTLQAAIEHGLWGDLIFTIGLGWYFYGGSIGHFVRS
jgi:membrane protease YdiL (CAAX protease family)